MTEFNLIAFADHSAKIPNQALAPETRTGIFDSWKFFASHLMDFWTVSSIATLSALMFNQSMITMLMTNKIYTAFKAEHIIGLSFLLMPVMLFTYFFFSYFMNHGQSIAMTLLKKRVVMESQNFTQAAQSALQSTLFCLSFGLSYRWQTVFRSQFQGHDYLYHQLMTEKSQDAIDLLKMIDNFSEKAPELPEEVPAWKEAA